MQNHYFDPTHPLHPYTHSTYTTPGTVAPVNALRDAPAPNPEGKHPAEKNGKWIEIEDNRGKEGFVNGNPHTILDFGPLPEGWSDTPSPPTTEELLAQLRNIRDSKLSSTDKYILPDYPISLEKLVVIKAYRQDLRDLPAQEGAPWDGGGSETPWPETPNSF